MTDNQTSILLKSYAERLEQIRSEIFNELPEDFKPKETKKRMFKLPNQSETFEVETCPILDELSSFIYELREDAKSLRESALKQKSKV